MKFSVILPVYNRAHSIKDALQSVLDQTRPADEIIVVDDGSTDDLAGALAPYMSRIILLQQANAGAAAARNAGCARATGDWLTFQDSDDLWTEDHLAVVERDLSGAATGIAAHLGDLLYTGPGYSQSLFLLKGKTFSQSHAEHIDDPLPLVVSGMHLSASAIRKNVWDKLGGLDQEMRIHEDTAFFVQLALEGPFMVTGHNLGIVRRLQEDTPALSYLVRTEKAYACRMHVRVFERVLNRDLSPRQRKLIRLKLSGAQLRLAESVTLTNPREAGAILRSMARSHPSPYKGWLKAIIAGLPGGIGYRFLNRRRGFYRK